MNVESIVKKDEKIYCGIHTSNLASGKYASKIRIITADEKGKKLGEYTASTADEIIVDTQGAAAAEIMPIYEYSRLTLPEGGVVLDDEFEDGLYDFFVIKGNTKQRADIYINGAMIANNLYANGYDTGAVNVISKEEASKPYIAHDVKVSGGKISVQIRDSEDCTIASLRVVRSPSVVKRVPKLWVIGDSLVQKYYGTASDETRGQRGWGQFLENFLTNDVEVVNLANAGDCAKGLSETALSGVKANGQAGDYFVIEGGYNDYKHYNEKTFYRFTVEMVKAGKEKGMRVILVSPNASLYSDKDGDDFNPIVRYSETVRRAAEDTGADYINLSEMSFKFFAETYGRKKDINDTYFLGKEIDGGCHINYLGAIKCAQLVVQDMYDRKIIACVDKNYSYTYTDSLKRRFVLRIAD